MRVIAFFLIFFACQQILPAFAEPSLSIHGSSTVYARFFENHIESLEKKIGSKINVDVNGSRRGVQDLIDGEADIAMISSYIENINAKIEGDVSNLKTHYIDTSRTAFIVHPSNPMSTINMKTITKIINGSIHNWSDFDDRDMPIRIIVETAGGGIRSTVENRLLNGQTMTGNLVEVPNGAQVAKITAQMPMAFGIAAVVTAKNQAVKILSLDQEIEQPLIIVTKGEPNKRTQKLINALREMASQ